MDGRISKGDLEHTRSDQLQQHGKYDRSIDTAPGYSLLLLDFLYSSSEAGGSLIGGSSAELVTVYDSILGLIQIHPMPCSQKTFYSL